MEADTGLVLLITAHRLFSFLLRTPRSLSSQVPGSSCTGEEVIWPDRRMADASMACLFTLGLKLGPSAVGAGRGRSGVDTRGSFFV